MIPFVFLTLLFGTAPGYAFPLPTESPLKGKTICLDAGHGGTALTDSYRVGPTGEREEWVNLRVALILEEILLEKGANVVMTRREDVFVPLPDRAQICRDAKADVFVSIHHNATADSSVNFPILYFHGYASENQGSVALGQLLGKALVKHFFDGQVMPTGNFVSLVSDLTIFPDAGASVLRNTYGIPAILAEASFFTNPTEEELLKTKTHNRKEAEAYLQALEAFFEAPVPVITEKNATIDPIPPFKAFQEAERMTPIARLWKQDFNEAEQFMKKGNRKSLQQALELFTRSARSFPDSYLAAACHANRAAILQKLGQTDLAKQELTRSREFFVTIPGL